MSNWDGKWWIVLAAGPVGDSAAKKTGEEAWDSWTWRARVWGGYADCELGTARAACSPRIAGPYDSRRQAEAADISDPYGHCPKED